RGLNFRSGRRSASRPPCDADGIAHDELAPGSAELNERVFHKAEHARVRRAVETSPFRIGEERTNPDGVFGAAEMRRRFGDGARDGLNRTEHKRAATP